MVHQLLEHTKDLRRHFTTSKWMASALTATQALKDSYEGVSTDSPRGHKFSILVECMAGILLILGALAEKESLKFEHHLTSFLLDWIFKYGPSIKEHAETYAAMGPMGDVVCIGSRQYASAHHAVVGEAEVFLVRFGPTLYPKCLLEDGFDSSVVDENWRRARKAIANHFSERWLEGFQIVPARIRRERATVKCQSLKSPATAGSPSDGNRPKKIDPTPDTVKVIQRIKKGHDNDTIANATGKTVGSVRKIRSLYKHDMYKL
jgi:hypothetical protein